MAIELAGNTIIDLATEDTLKDRYLTFRIEDEEYGIEIAYVKEIVRMQKVTWVPALPDYIEGLTNLRGELIGVIDVRKRFMKPWKEEDEDTCIIVIKHDDFDMLGLIVDGVKESVTIPEQNVSAPPSAKLSYSNQFVRNIGRVSKVSKDNKDKSNDVDLGKQSLKLLLDLEKFLSYNI